MSLLTDLRAAAPAELDESPWLAFRRAMPVLVPGLEITKLETHNNGRVGARGKTPMQGTGRYYFVLVLDPIGTGRADGRRELRLGVSKYRDEADSMIYELPFTTWVDPRPGAVAVWLAGVLLTRTPYSPR